MFPRYDQFRNLLSCVILLDLNVWIAVCNKADSLDSGLQLFANQQPHDDGAGREACKAREWVPCQLSNHHLAGGIGEC